MHGEQSGGHKKIQPEHSASVDVGGFANALRDKDLVEIFCARISVWQVLLGHASMKKIKLFQCNCTQDACSDGHAVKASCSCAGCVV